MTQKNKKQKGKRVKTENKSGKIIELIELKYIAKVLCWCGNTIIIDSSKPITENTCSECGSPYKLLNEEWTEEEQKRYIELIEQISRGVD